MSRPHPRSHPKRKTHFGPSRVESRVVSLVERMQAHTSFLTTTGSLLLLMLSMCSLFSAFTIIPTLTNYSTYHRL